MSQFFHFSSVIACLLLLAGCAAPLSPLVREGHHADYITVDKSDRLMTVWEHGEPLKTYPLLSLGWQPVGAKNREDDGKTPEGHYLIDEKHVSERFQKFLHISYPGIEDIANAKSLGVSPGGAVGIHGDKGGFKGWVDRQNPAWTTGCISVSNDNIEELYQLVPLGTEIFIQP